jgi:hypothetical protein
MDFPCNQGIAGVHEGQVHAWRHMAGSGMTAFAALGAAVSLASGRPSQVLGAC